MLAEKGLPSQMTAGFFVYDLLRHCEAAKSQSIYRAA